MFQMVKMAGSQWCMLVCVFAVLHAVSPRVIPSNTQQWYWEGDEEPQDISQQTPNIPALQPPASQTYQTVPQPAGSSGFPAPPPQSSIDTDYVAQQEVDSVLDKLTDLLHLLQSSQIDTEINPQQQQIRNSQTFEQQQQSTDSAAAAYDDDDVISASSSATSPVQDRIPLNKRMNLRSMQRRPMRNVLSSMPPELINHILQGHRDPPVPAKQLPPMGMAPTKLHSGSLSVGLDMDALSGMMAALRSKTYGQRLKSSHQKLQAIGRK